MNSKPSDQTLDGQTRTGAANSLGGQLRRAREARGVSLREISDQTRISRRHLEAIEADDFTQLPGGIFNRSFIKAYARYVGFDEQEALAAYERTVRAHGVSPDDIPISPHRSRVYTDGDTGRSPLVTGFLSIIILAILSLAVYAGLHWYQRRSANRTDQTDNAAPVTNAGADNQKMAGQNTASSPSVLPASAPLVVQVKAKGEPVWIGWRSDEDGGDATLKADEIREFTPQSRLSLKYSKSKIGALEVTINGRAAKLPTDSKSIVEMVITKEDYERLLQ